jgi:DNA-binding NarL/FixJ family response regulator
MKPEYSVLPIRVLIVEDYRLARLNLRSILSGDAGLILVGEAETGEMGVAMAKTHQPDVVLMDLGLPGICGIEASRQIKALNPAIKIMIYTSCEEEQAVLAALGAGANAYCLKETDPVHFQQTIRLVAEGGAWLDPAIANVALRLFLQPTSPVFAVLPGQTVSSNNPTLTDREMEVLRLLVEGKSNTEIAKILIISTHTAKAHVCNILEKLAVHDRVQAAVKAVKTGMV